MDSSKLIESAVVQIYAQVVQFNWLEPYVISDQIEQLGTGFFIDSQGHIITNAHLVDEAKTIWIQMVPFGQEGFFVDIVGFCPEYDLALLKVRPEDYKVIVARNGAIPFLPLGNSDLVKRSDPVLVLGYPLGQRRIKSSQGIISGWESSLGRTWIQISAPINPGNSGAPLINNNGEVIGIAQAGVIDAQNVGYAIAINELKIIIDQLYNQGLVRRPYLGLTFNSASDELAQLLGNPVPAGFYINRVLHGSLAQKAGVQEGDMLYSFNGNEIDAYGDLVAPWSGEKTSLYDLYARVPIGSIINLVLYRSGTMHTISLPFDLVDPLPIRIVYPDYEPVDYEIVAGMIIMELTVNHIGLLYTLETELLEYAKIEKRIEPILVIAHILPGSQAHICRSLAPAALLVELNDKEVRTLASFRQALELSLSSGFLKVKTSRGAVAAFSFKKVIEDDVRMAQYFGYQLSTDLYPQIKLIGS